MDYFNSPIVKGALSSAYITISRHMFTFIFRYLNCWYILTDTFSSIYSFHCFKQYLDLSLRIHLQLTGVFLCSGLVVGHAPVTINELTETNHTNCRTTHLFLGPKMNLPNGTIVNRKPSNKRQHGSQRLACSPFSFEQKGAYEEVIQFRKICVYHIWLLG